MSARPATLFELFGDFTALWPVELLQETIGAVVGDPQEIDTWLAALNAALKISNIRLGSIDGRAAPPIASIDPSSCICSPRRSQRFGCPGPRRS